jgi:hypothetical protein
MLSVGCAAVLLSGCAFDAGTRGGGQLPAQPEILQQA